MSSEIGITVIGVTSALLGTTMGGLISYFTNKAIKQKEWWSSILRDEINERKKLYSDFLAEATRLTWVSIEAKQGDLKDFHLLGNLTAQIELLGSDGVVNASKAIMAHVLSLHSSHQEKPGLAFFDVKTTFINEVKQEINNLKNS